MNWVSLSSEIFALLSDAGVQYCLLRAPKESIHAERPGDIDLLVDPGDLSLLYDTLARVYALRPLSFIQTHAQLPVIDPATGNELKLDLHGPLYFGMSGGFFRFPIEKRVLARRVNGDVPRPTPEDELTLLMLHTLLDKAKIISAYLPRLAAMVVDLRARQQDIIEMWSTFFPQELARLIWRCLEEPDTSALELARRRLQWHLWRSSPRRSTGHMTRAQIRARAYLQFWPLDRPFTVALLGPDGVGKTTIAQSLASDGLATYTYMGGKGAILPTTRLIHAVSSRRNAPPVSRSPSPSVNVKRASVGDQKTWPNIVKDHTTRPAIRLHQVAELGARYFSAVAGPDAPVAVFDRYVFDHLLPRQGSTKLGWSAQISARIYRDLFPVPDLVILLTAPTSTLQKRKEEHSIQELECKKQGYRQLLKEDLASRTTKLVEISTTEDLATTTAAVRTTIEKARLDRLRSLQ